MFANVGPQQRSPRVVPALPGSGPAADFIYDTATDSAYIANNAGAYQVLDTGSGDIGGSTGSVDNAALRADGTGGKTLQASPVIIADTTGLITGTQGVTISGGTSGSVALAATATGGQLTVGTGPTTITDAAGKILSAALNTVGAAQGGTGIANNASSTLTISGNFGTTLTVSGSTSVTLPTSGTLATLAGAEELTNKTLNASVGKGTWTASGTWTLPALTLGGTVSGGGQQLNNIIIGATTPLAGSFTTVNASTSVTIGAGSAITSSGAGGAIGTAAFKNTGTSGNAVPLLDGANTFSDSQTVTKNQNATTGVSITNSDTTNTTSRSVFSATNGTVVAQMIALSGNGAFIGATSSDVLNLMAGGVTKVVIGTAGTVTLNSGVTNAAGTPGSLCYNTGTFEMTKNNALTCTVSSRQFKKNIRAGISSAISVLSQIRPVRFAYKDQPERMRYGFISEELAEVDPRLADGYDAKGSPTSIDQNALLSLIIQSIQEYMERHDTQTAILNDRINGLWNQVNA